MFAATRFRIGGIAFLILAFACVVAPARAALPSSWAPGTVQPSPSTAGERFGESLANAGDLDRDGRDDIVVGAPGYTDSALGPGVSGRVYAMDTTGAPIWSQPATSPAQPSHIGAPTAFGTRVARLGDIGTGNCSTSCTLDPVRDGAAEILAGAPGTDLSSAQVDAGIVYVLDGATGALLKEVRVASVAGANLGEALASLSGQAPCSGFGGVGPCAHPSSSPVAIGDVNGGGLPDFAVGAPGFTEFDGDNVCPDGASCPGIGRAFVIFGEQISGSSLSPLTTPGTEIKFPGSIGSNGSPRFGAAIAPIGDLGSCIPAAIPPNCLGPTAPSTTPDDSPDLIISAPGDEDVSGPADAGAAYVLDAATNTAMARITDPQPVEGGAFGSFDQASPATGDLGSSATPDVVVGAKLGAGAAVVFSGDVLAPSPIASFTDPAPVSDGAFGAAAAGLGDVAGDTPGEIALGAAGGARAGSVHIASACANTILRKIVDPAGESGAAFGAAIAPIGDRNSPDPDGFIDLAVSAPGADAGAGRVYTFTSTGPAGPAFAGCGGPVGPGSGSGAGSPGSGTSNPPKVRARVLRQLTMRPSKRRIARLAALRLNGKLRASAGQPACQRRQKIAIQRRSLRGGRFQTFDVAVTAKNGTFRASTRPSRSYLYRARVSQTTGCMGATSTRAKVVVKRASRASRGRG